MSKKFSLKASPTQKLKHQEVWTNSKGESIKVCDMTEERAKNTLNWMIKRDREYLERKFKKTINSEIKDLMRDLEADVTNLY